MNTRALPAGSSQYVLVDPRGGDRREIVVHTHRPASFKSTSPIVMVMHGRNRNGGDYRDWWVSSAEEYGALIVAPEFSEAQYAHPHEYNYAAMVDAGGRARPRGDWLFPAIDHVFDDARGRAGGQAQRYFLFGHSAGGQLVHRMITFAWSPRIERAVAANSGSYTLPALDEDFPFGLRGTGLSESARREVFARPLLVLLGENDVDPDDESLPRDPGAMRQGAHRFARGSHYYEVGRREAQRLGVPLGWRIATVPAVAHSGEQMSPAAAKHLLA